jgi:UPF0755 protein
LFTKNLLKKDERPRIAGVFEPLRLEMPLQADPTVIFAMKKKSNDFNQVIKSFLQGFNNASIQYII